MTATTLARIVVRALISRRRLIRYVESALFCAHFHLLMLLPAELFTFFRCIGGLHSGVVFSTLLLGHELSTGNLLPCL